MKREHRKILVSANFLVAGLLSGCLSGDNPAAVGLKNDVRQLRDQIDVRKTTIDKLQAEFTAFKATINTRITGLESTMNLKLATNTGMFAGGGVYVLIMGLAVSGVLGVVCWKLFEGKGQWQTAFEGLSQQLETHGRACREAAAIDAISKVKQSFNNLTAAAGIKSMVDKNLVRRGIMASQCDPAETAQSTQSQR